MTHFPEIIQDIIILLFLNFFTQTSLSRLIIDNPFPDRHGDNKVDRLQAALRAEHEWPLQPQLVPSEAGLRKDPRQQGVGTLGQWTRETANASAYPNSLRARREAREGRPQAHEDRRGRESHGAHGEDPQVRVAAAAVQKQGRLPEGRRPSEDLLGGQGCRRLSECVLRRDGGDLARQWFVWCLLGDEVYFCCERVTRVSSTGLGGGGVFCKVSL